MFFTLTTVAYLLGSVPSGYLLGKLAGVDVTRSGSGNIGATNVARTLGKTLGILTLVVDVAKGYVPALIALRLEWDPWAVALVALAAFLGHLYPIFLRFRGGKGVATALGTLLAVGPVATLILMGIFSAVVVLSRRVSLGSIAAAFAAPVVFWVSSAAAEFVAMSAFMAAMVILRHRDNIKRLRAGTEPRFSSANSR